MGGYIPKDERLRRIGELLLTGVYLWAESGERAAPAQVDRPSGVVGPAATAIDARRAGSAIAAGSPAHADGDERATAARRGGVGRRGEAREKGSEPGSTTAVERHAASSGSRGDESGSSAP